MIPHQPNADEFSQVPTNPVPPQESAAPSILDQNSDQNQGIADAQATPQPGVRRFNCDFPADVFSEVEMLAAESGVSKRDVVVGAVQYSLLGRRQIPRLTFAEVIATDIARLVQVVALAENFCRELTQEIRNSSHADPTLDGLYRRVCLESEADDWSRHLAALRRQLAEHLTKLPTPKRSSHTTNKGSAS